jgi:hypothetical protein
MCAQSQTNWQPANPPDDKLQYYCTCEMRTPWIQHVGVTTTLSINTPSFARRNPCAVWWHRGYLLPLRRTHFPHGEGVPFASREGCDVGAYYNTGQLSVALCTITDFAARDWITQLQLIRHKPWSVQEHADVRPRVAGRSFRYLEAFLPLNRT